MEYSNDYKLIYIPTDEELQDICYNFRAKFENLISSNTPRVTIMIAAHNEELYLPVMLHQLSQLQTKVPLEIVAIDNASTDRTKEIIKESGLKLVTEKIKGVSYARQAGLEASQGEYIFSTDADTQVPTTWIDANLKYFENNPNLVCFTGGSEPNGGHITYWIIRKIVRQLRKTSKVPLTGTWTFPGHNMVYNRQDAINVGGYQLGTDLGEDNLLARKLRMRGDILRVDNDSEVKVLTSARRISTFGRVTSIVASRFRDYGLNILNYDNMNNTLGKTFTDIR